MVTKRSVLAKAAKVQVVVVRATQGNHDDPDLELLAPTGFMFDGQTHSLLCFGWADAWSRLDTILEPCPADCDCEGKAWDLTKESVVR